MVSKKHSFFERKKLKKPLSLILVFIGLILFVLPMILQKPIIIPKENLNKTIGWKEYKSSEYHFSFKYPEGLLSSFQVRTTGPIDTTLKQLVSNNVARTAADPNAYNVFFEANGWKFTGTLDQFVKKNVTQTKNTERQSIKLGNTSGLRISNLDEKADAYFYYNLFKHGNFVYNFAIFADNADEVRGNTKLLDDIIGTAKFSSSP